MEYKSFTKEKDKSCNKNVNKIFIVYTACKQRVLLFTHCLHVLFTSGTPIYKDFQKIVNNVNNIYI